MKDVQHLLRVAVIFAAVFAAFLGARKLLIPESFGRLGHYRANAVEEFAAQPPHYAGEAACKRCHPQPAADKAGSSHRSISCESCHGALSAHVNEPKSAAGPRRPKEAELRAFCGHCHEKSLSKPAKFPQIDVKKHYPDGPCNMCHQPHKPK